MFWYFFITGCVVFWLLIGLFEVRWAYRMALKWEGHSNLSWRHNAKAWGAGPVLWAIVGWPFQLAYFSTKLYWWGKERNDRGPKRLMRFVKGQ